MNTTSLHKILFALALTSIASTSLHAAPSPANSRTQGPCDIYATVKTPCIAAHSTTRALYAAYTGPLYQVKRESDGHTLDIGSLPSATGRYTNAAAQDAFCTNTLCVINLIYDQSGHGNHLFQAAPGTFKGVAKGAFDTQPIADMATISIAGHKAYGVYIIPGMGFRNNDATGIAIGDEPEGIYYVVDGTHYDSGCCFDYGNSSTNGRAVGTGTMETTYFGTSTTWGSGAGPGPWIMSDMEAGLFSGHSAKQNIADPTVDSWRFVTAMMGGGGYNSWDLRGGNAQQGALTTFYSGARPGDPDDGRYYPMHKQGGILLGTGGDNGNGSSGTFYEGVMTTGYPSEATATAVQSNIVAARYAVAPIELAHVPPFTPGSRQKVTATFTNITGKPIDGLTISLDVPGTMRATTFNGHGGKTNFFEESIVPGASVTAEFIVTAPTATITGYLTARAAYKPSSDAAPHTETASTRVRSAYPVKINEVRFGSAANPTDQFIELYNASDSTVDISSWSLIATAGQWSPMQLSAIPAGTKLAARGFYLLGLAGNGLAAPAASGTKTILLHNITGLSTGQTISIDGESRTIASVGTAASPPTAVFIPVSTNPRLTLPAGSTHLPITTATGFEVGQKIGIDLGGNYEAATVTAIGRPGTQTTLTAAVTAGATSIQLAAASNITTGDSLTIGTGAQKEVVKVASTDASSAALASPLRFAHASGIDVSDLGTGITFTPATGFPHHAGDALQALGSGITLDKPLMRTHPYGAPVLNSLATTSGYQGTPAPNQWFGTPLSAGSGSIVLQDAGTVADAIVYTSQQSNSSGNGTIPSPELATLVSDQGKGGCIIPAGNAGGAGGGTGRPDGPTRSWGRYPDGADTGSLCSDFHVQTAASLAAASLASSTNIKISSIDGFSAGQKIMIDSGVAQESAVIASIGTSGATSLNAAVAAGTISLPVASAFGFRPGQAITIGEGADQEAATVAAVPRRGASAITINSPLKSAHPSSTQVAGTGITLNAPLARAHATGSLVSDNAPTPGTPNSYATKSR